MEKELLKILYKVLPFVLCICIVSGAAAPAYATSNTGQYDFNIYQNTNTLVTYSSSTNSFVSNIYTLLSQFKTNFDAYYSSWNTSNFLPNSLLNSINSSITTLNNNYVNNSANLSKLTDIYNTLVAINADTFTIDSNVDNIYTWVMAIGQALAGIQTDVSGIKTDTANLSGIKTDTANLSGIKTDTSNLSGIKADIETFNSDYNDINWIEDKSRYLGVKTDINGDYVFSGRATGDAGLYFFYNLPIENAFVYKLRMPFGLYGAVDYDYVDFNISVYINGRNYDLTDGIVSYQTHRAYTDVYLTYPREYQSLNSFPTVFHVTSNSTLDIKGSGLASLFYLTDNKDGIDISKYNILFNINSLFEQAKEVFFDDKTIAAKKANQAQEDSVLSNFTGSGAASASVSDFGAVKDSMVNFKAGFTGGASSSDTFSFLSGESNAWDWFTQDIANDLDRTQGSNTRLLRSSSDVAYDTPLLDSYYTSILSILGGD